MLKADSVKWNGLNRMYAMNIQANQNIARTEARQALTIGAARRSTPATRHITHLPQTHCWIVCTYSGMIANLDLLSSQPTTLAGFPHYKKFA